MAKPIAFVSFTSFKWTLWHKHILIRKLFFFRTISRPIVQLHWFSPITVKKHAKPLELNLSYFLWSVFYSCLLCCALLLVSSPLTLKSIQTPNGSGTGSFQPTPASKHANFTHWLLMLYYFLSSGHRGTRMWRRASNNTITHLWTAWTFINIIEISVAGETLCELGVFFHSALSL